MNKDLTRVDAVESILTLANLAGDSLYHTAEGRQKTLLSACSMLEKLGVTDDELARGAARMLSTMFGVSPLMRDVNHDSTVSSVNGEDAERKTGTRSKP